MEGDPREDVSRNTNVTSIEEILRRLSSVAETTAPAIKCNEGKLLFSINIIKISPELLNEMIPGVNISCAVSFCGETSETALTSSIYSSNTPLIFDCFEYYGQDIVEFKLTKSFGGVFQQEIGRLSLRMMEILAGQEKSFSSGLAFGVDRTLRLFERTVDLTTLCLRIHGRYVRIENCLKSEMKLFSSGTPRIVKTNFTELHRVATSGCPALLKQLLSALSSKNLLMNALGLRSSCGKSVLDAAVGANNHRIVKVLLQRAGVWCFQGTIPNVTSTLHVAVRAAAQRAPPFPEASISSLEDVYDLITSLPEQTKSLLYLLKFMQRFRDSIIGWENSPSFSDMVDWRDEHNMTALMWACSLGKVSAVKLLLQFGADSSLINPVNKQSCLIMATAAKSFACVSELMSAKHETTFVEDLMYYSLWFGKASVIKFICIPCHFDCSGKSALAVAAELGLTEIFSFFLQQHIPYRIVDNEGNTPLHLAAASGHLDICQLILDAEREQIIREIELELGGPEKMQGEFEKASSSFRGGIRTKCKKCTETPHKVSTFSSMTTRRPWLREKNYWARSAAESARISGHIGVATLIENICLEVYSKDFIDLQISFVLNGKCGRSSNRSLSSLNANISSIRSFAPLMRASLIQKEGFDDEADSANYSFALVTQGSLLGEYIESQRDIEVVYKDEKLSEAKNEHCMSFSKTVELELPVSTVHSMVQNDESSIPSSSSHIAILPVGLAAMKPIDISALPEFKAKSHNIEVGRVEILCESSLKKKASTEESEKCGQMMKAQIKEHLPRYTLNTSDKENKMVPTSEDVEVVELREVSENISAIRRNSARDLSNKNSSQLLISIRKSFSDSKLKLESLMKR